MNKQKDVVDKWDNLAYCWTLKENVDYQDLTKVDYRLIQTKNLKDKLMLDVGSGLPVKVKYFAKTGGKLVSIDISREIAKKVREFIDETNLKRSCEVVVGDARQLPFKNRIFDLVVSYSTIDHIPYNYQKAICEMARVGKGEVVITTENKLQVGIVVAQYYLQNKNKGVHPTLGYVHYFFPWELKKMMSDAGLIITRFDAQRFRLPIWPSYGANLLLDILHILIGPLNRLFFLISTFCERRGNLKFLYQRIGFSSKVSENNRIYDEFYKKTDADKAVKYFKNPPPDLKQRMDVTLNLLKPQKGEKILDAGCGYGIYSIAISKLGVEVIGSDISAEALRLARKFSEKSDNSISYIIHDLENLPFRDQTFDKIICLETLEHIDEDRLSIQRLQKVLKKGGYLLVSVPSENFPFLWDPKKYIISKFRPLTKKELNEIGWRLGNCVDHKRLYDEKYFKEHYNSSLNVGGFPTLFSTHLYHFKKRTGLLNYIIRDEFLYSLIKIDTILSRIFNRGYTLFVLIKKAK